MFEDYLIKEISNALISLFEARKELSVTDMQKELQVSRKLIVEALNAIRKNNPNLIITSECDRFKFKLNVDEAL